MLPLGLEELELEMKLELELQLELEELEEEEESASPGRHWLDLWHSAVMVSPCRG